MEIFSHLETIIFVEKARKSSTEVRPRDAHAKPVSKVSGVLSLTHGVGIWTLVRKNE